MLDHILLVQRKDVPVWVLPGGGIDTGETAEDAAARELFEETGLQIPQLRHIATFTQKSRLTTDTYFFYGQMATEEALSGTGLTLCPIETADAKFFPISELPRFIFPIHKEWIKSLIHHIRSHSEEDLEPLIRPIYEVTPVWILKMAICHPLLVIRYLLFSLYRAV